MPASRARLSIFMNLSAVPIWHQIVQTKATPLKYLFQIADHERILTIHAIVSRFQDNAAVFSAQRTLVATRNHFSSVPIFVVGLVFGCSLLRPNNLVPFQRFPSSDCTRKKKKERETCCRILYILFTDKKRQGHDGKTSINRRVQCFNC